MKQTVADVLLARLREWRVRQFFGYPGDGINGLLAGWGRADDKRQFVQGRRQEAAAFEAVASPSSLEAPAYCVPASHGPVAAAIPNVRHVEYFIDHARLEPLLVDGTPAVHDGALHPDPSRRGHGVSMHPGASRYRTTECGP